MMPNSVPPSRLQSSIESRWGLLEFVASTVIAVAAAAILGDGHRGTRLGDLLGDNRATLYGTVAAVAGSMLGFVLAGATIILTIAGSPKVNRVTESDQYGNLWSMFLAATKGLGLLTIAAVAALLFDRKDSPEPVFAYSVLLLATLSATQIGTCIWILEKLTKLMVKQRMSTRPGGTLPQAR